MEKTNNLDFIQSNTSRLTRFEIESEKVISLQLEANKLQDEVNKSKDLLLNIKNELDIERNRFLNEHEKNKE
jgi:hypothetical protein